MATIYSTQISRRLRDVKHIDDDSAFWAGDVIVCLLLVVLVWMCVRWAIGKRNAYLARTWIRYYDGSDGKDVGEVLVIERERGHVSLEPNIRIRVRKHDRLARALAEEGYFQFGARQRTPENLMITRKFLRDKLALHSDLRKRDAAMALDLALTLSFVPTQQWLDMEKVVGTSKWSRRVDPTGSYFGWVASIWGC
jgi:hypothetical protein